jgi:predicted RNA-binding protein
MQEENQAWLCIVNRDNLEIIKEKRLYGVPEHPTAVKRLSMVKQNDDLLFYAVSPACKILGKSKASSLMFKENKLSPWENRLYPYRIKISKIDQLYVPLRMFINGISSIHGRIQRGASIIPLKKEDFDFIVSKNFGKKYPDPSKKDT